MVTKVNLDTLGFLNCSLSICSLVEFLHGGNVSDVSVVIVNGIIFILVICDLCPSLYGILFLFVDVTTSGQLPFHCIIVPETLSSESYRNAAEPLVSYPQLLMEMCAALTRCDRRWSLYHPQALGDLIPF